MTYDGAVWGTLACALSALGAALTYLGWQRRGGKGVAAALRGTAWTILPIAAWLTGTLRLVTEVLGDVGDWATRLVFSPTVWLGICLAGVSALLFVVSGALSKRGAARSPEAVTGSPRTRRRGRSHEVTGGGKASGTGEDDMDDIAAILRKHGIS